MKNEGLHFRAKTNIPGLNTLNRLNFEIENRDVLFVAKERKVENKRDNSYGSTLIRNNSCDRI